MCGLRSLPIFEVNVVLAELWRNTYLLNKLSSEQTDIIPWSFFAQGGFAANCIASAVNFRNQFFQIIDQMLILIILSVRLIATKVSP